MVEQTGYTAKAHYFHNYTEFKQSWGLDWSVGMGVGEGMADYMPAWTYQYGNKLGAWKAVKVPDVQVPAKFSVADKYARLAVQAQRFEQQAFNDYVQVQSDSVTHEGKPADNAVKANAAYNRLVLGERNYQTYKNLYLAEYTKLNKIYK